MVSWEAMWLLIKTHNKGGMAMKGKVIWIMGIVAIALFIGGMAVAQQKYPNKPFEFIAPAGPGGGWDTTIRMVARVLQEEKLVPVPMPVVNKPGGGGGVALAYLQQRKGDPYTVAVYSPPLLLINLTGQTKLSYKDTTPIARLISDYGAFAVPKSSPYRTINDVMNALKKDPKSVKVGGLSSPGSMDHVQFLIAAKAAGIENLAQIPYIAFQEGQHLAALLGGHIDLLSTGLAETEGPMMSGDIRVLAISRPQPYADGPFKGVPTLRQAGIDAEFINWRGLFGPPGMPDYAVKYLEEKLAQMEKTKLWDEICRTNGWDKSFLPSSEFKTFLEKTNEEYKEVLKAIGFYKGE